MKDLKIMKVQVDCLREMYKDDLKSRIEHLVLDLQRELKKMEADNYKPNSCGIIQGQAREIDNLAVKLGVLDSVDR